MNLVREPDAGNPPVRFDEREVETEHGRRILRHTRGNPDTEVSRSLNHRATSRLYPESFCGRATARGHPVPISDFPSLIVPGIDRIGYSTPFFLVVR